MITTKATVTSYVDGVAKVSCQRQSSCSGCKVERQCGGKMFNPKGSFLLTIDSPMPLKAGQIVLLGINEGQFWATTLAAYLFPLIVLIITTFITEIWLKNELIRFWIIIGCVIISFLLLKMLPTKKIKPILLKILN